MADTIRRDAAAYAEKCANYRSAAQRRVERQREEQALPSGDRLELLVRQRQEKKTERPDWAAL